MRCFLGLDLDAKTKLAVQAWRDKSLLHFERPVPVANFHVTSVFLGQVDEHQLDHLCSQIDSLEFDSFTLQFDYLGYWSKPKILWLGSSQTSESATLLANTLSGFAKHCRLPIHEKKYTPHITIVRKAPEHSPAPLFDPSFECKFTALHLFESVSGKQGVRYPIRKSWPFRMFKRPG